MKITSSELREKYLKFFEKKGHKIIPSASLVPENDPTVLFTTAGMQPLVPYLLGQKHPDGTRLASCQKCIRTGDIDDVGDDTHCTYFEMLGNWSLGDYGKKEAIEFSFEFLIKELGVPLERFAVTCFEGDADAPRDTEAAEIWQNLGIKKERIAFLPKEDNWWGPAGKTGPCGPDSEMFYWKNNSEPAPKVFDPKNKNWVEIWNDVFMIYVKNEDGKIVDAKQKNIDTGMGLERAVAVLNGKDNVYDTDIFEEIFKKIPVELDQKQKRIIADHSRAINALIADGVEPSNKERGYVLRRLMRRIIAYEFLSKKEFLKDLISSAFFQKKGLNF
jgi:alanyl-tRNA synthetase